MTIERKPVAKRVSILSMLICAVGALGLASLIFAYGGPVYAYFQDTKGGFPHLTSVQILGAKLGYPALISAFFSYFCEPRRSPAEIPTTEEASLVKYRDLYGIQMVIAVWGIALLAIFKMTDIDTCKELGNAFIIASVVSTVFDIQYHKRVFGDFVEHIDRNVEILNSIVGNPSGFATADSNSNLSGLIVGLDKNISSLTTIIGRSPEDALSEAVVSPGSLSSTVVNLTNTVNDLSTSFGRSSDELSVLVKELSKQVETSNNILGYLDFRSRIQEAYISAKQRVLSVSDYWVIDPQWWFDADWQRCPSYSNLRRSEVIERKVVFAGAVPWPEYSPRLSQQDDVIVKLSPHDFERFLGVIWRLVIAHKLRNDTHTNKRDKIRVVVGYVPVSATVIDDDVYALLQVSTNASISTSRGSKVAERDAITADAYEQLICRHLQHVRSAREYVESMLTVAILSSNDLTLDTPASPNSLMHCLIHLGLDEWAKANTGLNLDYDLKNERANAIVCAFYASLNYKKETFRDIRRDLL